MDIHRDLCRIQHGGFVESSEDFITGEIIKALGGLSDDAPFNLKIKYATENKIGRQRKEESK